MSTSNQHQLLQQTSAHPGIESSQQTQATTEVNYVGDTGYMSPRSPLSENFQTQQATNSTPNEGLLKFSPTTDNRGELENSDFKPQSAEPNPQDDNNDGQKLLIEQFQKNMGLSNSPLVGGPSMMGLISPPGQQVPFSVGSQGIISPQFTPQKPQDLSSSVGINLPNIYAGGNKEKYTQLEQMIKTQIPLSTATLMVKVVPEEESDMTKNWQLTKEDLEKVFNPHGTILKIEVGNQNACGLVTFENLMQAFSARSYLHGKRLLKGINATLHVQFVQAKKGGEPLSDNKTQSEEEKNSDQQNQAQQQFNEQLKHMQWLHHQNMAQLQYQIQMQQEMLMKQQQSQSQQQQSPHQQGFSPGQNVQQKQHPQQNLTQQPQNQSLSTSVRPFMPTVQTQPIHGQQQSQNVQSNEYEEQDQGIKYTCSYEIQIENEKEFQVARRVIGSKGSNMKRIIEECAYGFDPDISPYEIVKLRLRGKGSGFKEGRNQEESEDPLNLCISSKYKEKYDYACAEMETLLLQVYDEYRQFYRYKPKKPTNYNTVLRIKKKETTTKPPKPGAMEEDDETQNRSGYNNSQYQQQHQQHQYNSYYPQQQQFQGLQNATISPSAFAPHQGQKFNGFAQPFIPSMRNANGSFQHQQQ